MEIEVWVVEGACERRWLEVEEEVPDAWRVGGSVSVGWRERESGWPHWVEEGLVIWLGSRRTRYLRLGFCRICCTISSVFFRTVMSGRYRFPPSASISFLTATSQEFISSALFKTSRRVETQRRESPRNPKRENTDRDRLPRRGPSSAEVWDICSTQCFPGIASQAKAAESFPSCMIFSGNLSKLPSPAYCNRYPAVAKT